MKLLSATHKRVHIAQIITEFSPFGAERVGYSLADAVSRQSWSSTIYGVRHYSDRAVEEELRGKLERGGIKTVILNRRSCADLKGYVWAALNFGRFLPRDKVSILHSHTDVPDFVTALANITWGRPVVRTLHNTVIWPGRIATAAITERLLRPRVEVAVSRDVLASWPGYVRRLRLNRPQSPRLIFNEIEIEGGAVDRGEALHHLGLERNKRHCVFVGRLVEQKGFDLLLSAVMNDRWPSDLIVHVYGAGPLQVELPPNASGKLIYHGITLGIAKYLRAFDFIVMPSRFEGLPLALLEACAAGIPVVASRCPGIEETLGVTYPYYIEPLSAIGIISQVCDFPRSPSSACGAPSIPYVGMTDDYLKLYAEISATSQL